MSPNRENETNQRQQLRKLMSPDGKWGFRRTNTEVSTDASPKVMKVGTHFSIRGHTRNSTNFDHRQKVLSIQLHEPRHVPKEEAAFE